MTEFRKGQKIELANGDTATVIKELGRGGQGIVYKVKLGGNEKALKWYSNKPTAALYKNLKRNIAAGSPSEEFIWP